MGLVLTLVAADPALRQAAEALALEALTGAGLCVKARQALGPQAVDLALDGSDGAGADLNLKARLHTTLSEVRTDFALQPQTHRRKRLLLADMDSTMITCECLDELADFAGVKDAVAAITERAMNGALDFEGALRARVAMLSGLPIEALGACYEARVRPTAGAEVLVRTMAAHGARSVLVSGGFGYFTKRVAHVLGFSAERGNVLLDDGTRLTGGVGEPILGRAAKLQALREEAALIGVGLEETLAVGDGANDLDMIRAAGLGVAFHAKPIVAAEASARIDHGDLRTLLYFQGFALADFAEARG
jgi:phosphoserine phosphatase